MNHEDTKDTKRTGNKVQGAMLSATLKERRSHAMGWRVNRRWGTTKASLECLAYCRELTVGINLLRERLPNPPQLRLAV